MIQTVNGPLFRALIESGIRNLSLHGREVNDLNVFPVPDGDTGTNMILTLKNGYSVIDGIESENLADTARAFSSAVVYGARGNSGVIISRFFKGFSDTLANAESATTSVLSRALCVGAEEAYKAVSHPTEGTMLTVLREAGDKARAYCDSCEGDRAEIKEIIRVFLCEARESLERTPALLPVLKKAGVVDSGGAGVVYVFEGMYKYLNGEQIAAQMPDIHSDASVNYDQFNKYSDFSYGYCTEFLLQLTDGSESFDYSTFLAFLNREGESVASSFDGDKVKAHVHTRNPESILSEAHRYGEFLALKIENMSVQHSEVASAQKDGTSDGRPEDAENKVTLCVPEEKREAPVSVVTCAPDRKTAELFLNMGADAVLCCPMGAAPATGDFLDAVSVVGIRDTVIFANHKNYVLSALKAADFLSSEASVKVVRSCSVAECYAALAILDYDSACAADIARGAEDAIANLYTVTVMQSVKDAAWDGIRIGKGDYLAMDAEKIIAADEELWELVKRVMDGYVQSKEREPDTVTVFTGMNAPEGLADMIGKRVSKKYQFTETDFVETDSETYDLILSFE